ncbi:MAG: XdhC family protein [Deltaproteobacteria bacterium]|nr:XdhC family protein [Deltaproteobacteria bacterium]
MGYVSDDGLLDRIAALRAAGTPFVIATVIGTRGSTPRKVGAKMIVGGDGGLDGTVGGGMVEHKVVERARALLAAPAVERFEWDLASEDAGGMVCGGRMEFLLEPFQVRPAAFVFGAGHVGEALSPVLLRLGFAVTVADDRAELLAADRLPGARLEHGDPAALAARLDIPASAFCVVGNKTHRHDQAVLGALLRRDPVPRYVGLMASRKKRGELFAAMEALGVPKAVVERVHCPVGLAIAAETPDEIAVAIAAEMVAELRGRKG